MLCKMMANQLFFLQSKDSIITCPNHQTSSHFRNTHQFFVSKKTDDFKPQKACLNCLVFIGRLSKDFTIGLYRIYFKKMFFLCRSQN